MTKQNIFKSIFLSQIFFANISQSFSVNKVLTSKHTTLFHLGTSLKSIHRTPLSSLLKKIPHLMRSIDLKASGARTNEIDEDLCTKCLRLASSLLTFITHVRLKSHILLLNARRTSLKKKDFISRWRQNSFANRFSLDARRDFLLAFIFSLSDPLNTPLPVSSGATNE